MARIGCRILIAVNPFSVSAVQQRQMKLKIIIIFFISKKKNINNPRKLYIYFRFYTWTKFVNETNN